MGRGAGKGSEANRRGQAWSPAKYEAVEASPVFSEGLDDEEDGYDGTIYVRAERRAFDHRPAVRHACLWFVGLTLSVVGVYVTTLLSLYTGSPAS